MAWIETHQELARHPKVRRLARELNVHQAQAIGHLVMLWWWAVDYAPDGLIADAEDVCDAAGWEHSEAEWFAKTLTKVGWLDTSDDGWHIHDWDEYAGKWVQSRSDRKRDGLRGAHERWHVGDGKKDPKCRLCSPPYSPPNGPPIGGTKGYTTVPNTTVPTTSIVENLADRAQHLARMFVGGRPSANDINGAARAIQAHPWLAELEDGELSMVLAKAKTSGTRFPSGLASVAGDFKPVKPLPNWCGACDETSRMVEVGDGFGNCPACHPGGAR